MGLKINFCALGFHDWGEATNTSDFHDTGVETLFYRPAIQTGEQSCTRDNCDAFRHVACHLKSGSDSETGKWMGISAERKAEIHRLPKFPAGQPITPLMWVY